MGSKYPPQVSQPLLLMFNDTDIPSLASLNGTIGLWDGKDMEPFSSLILNLICSLCRLGLLSSDFFSYLRE